MKHLLLLLLLTISTISFSQKVDTVIANSVYKSYVSYETRLPLFVAYKLYHGGGECDRGKNGFTFKTDNVKVVSDANYSHSGYDKGHLANAEDFAFNCELDELTFRYYNALPQTPNCNRGPWKSLETQIRKESQIDSLLIICGGYRFETKTYTWTNKNGKSYMGSIMVPDYCYKIVKNLRSGNIKCYVFTNDDNSVMTQVTYEKLMLMIPYSIEFMKYDLDF